MGSSRHLPEFDDVGCPFFLLRGIARTKAHTGHGSVKALLVSESTCIDYLYILPYLAAIFGQPGMPLYLVVILLLSWDN
jgi:hypothetical protein